MGHVGCHILFGSSLSHVFTARCGRVGSYLRSGIFNVNLRDCAMNSGRFYVNCDMRRRGLVAVSAKRFRPARDTTSGISSVLLFIPRLVLRMDHPMH